MAHSPLRDDADPQWQELHEAAERQHAALTRVLYTAFELLVARAVLMRIRAALRFGNTEAAMQAVPVATLLTLQPVVEAALKRAALEGAKIGLTGDLLVRLGSSEGLPVDDIAFWARTQAAKLVTGVSDQTRRALRQVILDAVQSGTSPARAAKLIESSVGLNTVQARALLNRSKALQEAGVSAEKIEARIARYAAKLRKQRARVIARHELLQAASAGRRAVWRRDVRNGIIAPDRWEREWVAIVPSDGRTCRYCQGQDGQVAPINGVYPNGSSGPPGHVLCRCTEVLRRVA